MEPTARPNPATPTKNNSGINKIYFFDIWFAEGVLNKLI